MERKVPIKNIYYMLCYVWDKINIIDQQKFSSDIDFNIYDFYADILCFNLSSLVKGGLVRKYIEVKETNKLIRGKIDFSTTIKRNTLQNNNIVCDFDEYIVNNIYNQIIKTTLNTLITKDIDQSIKKKLKHIYSFFDGVDLIHLSNEHFNKLPFDRNDERYLFPVKICHLIYNSLIVSEEEGDISFHKYLEDNMHHIFELFVYKFLKKEQTEYKVKHGSILNWEFSSGNPNLVPNMKLDIELTSDNRKIIIDTKYYEHIYQNYYDKNSFISGHLYQIFAYINKINFNGYIDGILLYPHNEEEPEIDEVYQTKVISNNQICNSSIRLFSVDLSKDWRDIKKRLLKVIEKEGEFNV